MPKLTWQEAQNIIDQKVKELQQLPENQFPQNASRLRPSKTLMRLLREERGGSREVGNRD